MIETSMNDNDADRIDSSDSSDVTTAKWGQTAL